MVPEGWINAPLGKLVEKVTRPVSVDPAATYQEIGIRSHGKGLFDKEPVLGAKLGEKRVFWVEPNCLVLNIVFAWEQAVGRTTEKDRGKIASHRFPMYKPRRGQSDVDYLLYLFRTPHGKHLLGLASPGGAGRNKTLGQSEFLKTHVCVPPIHEQETIVGILKTWDRAIELLTSLIQSSNNQKWALMQQLLSGTRRLDAFSGRGWVEDRLGSLVSINYGKSPKEVVNPNGTVPILGTGGQIGYASTALHHGPAVLIGRKGTIDQPQYVPGSFWPTDTTFFCTSSKCDIEWLSFKLTWMDLSRYNEASGVPSLSKRTLEAIKFQRPERDEQHAIARVLSAAQKEERLLEVERSLLQQQRTALTHQLLTGMLRVTSVTPKEAARA